MTGCDVLAVFAHPDDESLLAGGLLAACATAGLRVGIVSLTRGELGVVEEGERLGGASDGEASDGEASDGGASDGEASVQSARAPSSGAQLGEIRERELGEAAEALGAAWARCLGLPDGELMSVERAPAVDAVRELVSSHEPTVVVTFSSEGLYWHPDHIAAHEIVHQAAPPASVCEVTWPAGLLVSTIDELRGRGLPTDVWGLDPHAFGAPAGIIAHELDVSAFLDVKLRALRSHRSQLPSSQALAELPQDLALELLGREWLTTCARGGWLASAVEQGCAVRRARSAATSSEA
jgi:LmbE family N-acetylglucosaminyl deacetylase